MKIIYVNNKILKIIFYRKYKDFIDDMTKKKLIKIINCLKIVPYNYYVIQNT